MAELVDMPCLRGFTVDDDASKRGATSIWLHCADQAMVFLRALSDADFA